MTRQGNHFEGKSAGKHADLLRKRSKPEDFRTRVAAVIEYFKPVETGTKERNQKWKE